MTTALDIFSTMTKPTRKSRISLFSSQIPRTNISFKTLFYCQCATYETEMPASRYNGWFLSHKVKLLDGLMYNKGHFLLFDCFAANLAGRYTGLFGGGPLQMLCF